MKPNENNERDSYPHDSAVDSILDAAVASVSPILLRTVGPGHSEEFTRTLFVKFEQSQVLTDLSRALEKGSGHEPYQLEPHLSLVYARIPGEVKEKLAAEFCFPGEVRLDRVRAMETGRTMNSTDVNRWRAMADRALHCA